MYNRQTVRGEMGRGTCWGVTDNATEMIHAPSCSVYTSPAVGITVTSFHGDVSVSASHTDVLAVDQAGSPLSCY